MKRAQNVEEYLSLNAKDRNLLEKIRNVIVSSGIEETIKWGVPTSSIVGVPQ